MTLHTVNKSPFTSSLFQECLDVIGSQHSVLLIEDGVYGALSSNPLADRVIECAHSTSNRFYALQDDLTARGLGVDTLLAEVTPISYQEFVQLTIQHHRIQSWF